MSYSIGALLPKDQAQSFSWYRKAAEHGYSPAQSQLGLLYELGLGVPKDPKQALVWYRKVVAHGNDSIASTMAKDNIARLEARGVE